jgi:hypothetical protein
VHLNPDTEARIFFALLAFCGVAFIGGCIGIYFFGWQSIAVAAAVAFVSLFAAVAIFVSGL